MFVPMIIFAASQVGTPGPANMALMAASARFGVRRIALFMAGVILGKQLIIWPLGFGLLQIAQAAPAVFLGMKLASAAYMCWLAWKVAGMSLSQQSGGDTAPSFWAGLIVHPLNPKAWAMLTTIFTTFVPAGWTALGATSAVAIVLLVTQSALQPLWAVGGRVIAGWVQGPRAERILFISLAVLTVLSVFYALFQGGIS